MILRIKTHPFFFSFSRHFDSEVATLLSQKYSFQMYLLAGVTKGKIKTQVTTYCFPVKGFYTLIEAEKSKSYRVAGRLKTKEEDVLQFQVRTMTCFSLAQGEFKLCSY